jgi:hypothetical protein
MLELERVQQDPNWTVDRMPHPDTLADAIKATAERIKAGLPPPIDPSLLNTEPTA